MKEIIDYQVVIEEKYEFETRISKLIKEYWWQPYWFMSITEGWYLCQAMVKYKN